MGNYKVINQGKYRIEITYNSTKNFHSYDDSPSIRIFTIDPYRNNCYNIDNPYIEIWHEHGIIHREFKPAIICKEKGLYLFIENGKHKDTKDVLDKLLSEMDQFGIVDILINYPESFHVYK